MATSKSSNEGTAQPWHPGEDATVCPLFLTFQKNRKLTFQKENTKIRKQKRLAIQMKLYEKQHFELSWLEVPDISFASILSQHERFDTFVNKFQFPDFFTRVFARIYFSDF